MLKWLRRVFREGKVEGTWKSFCMTVSVSSENITEVRQYIQSFEGDKIRERIVSLPETITLFDIEFPVGEVKSTFVQARLEQHIREILAEQKECAIPLQFVPGSDPTYIKEYLDWIKLSQLTS
ncbi:hypothetical protein KDA_48650 [Dictyobacter alpinus]|uniref:Uncharacterized protein n=2 Tax=Dictyobacter alpinus TaxID=2014873 RepID=A0A402BD99_9CHLR|nr:hypothetical protein KDA_48650 [Dictyobacter alpinus]